MTLNEYQQQAMKTCMPSCNNIATWADRTPEEWETNLQKEVGDCLWFLAGICHVMGWQLGDIALQNIDKLQSRKQRGVIIGNGDNR